ncbi:hypothetical protein PRUPE_8G015900 [Prunus persica]|uniref:Uncharacterized protein n=1 Tax=Prunus persica TaxID=3760 RepID=M5VJY3_PRUPE|nr:hypothetical protein PRUPE_8G015900 [Prunus persica]
MGTYEPLGFLLQSCKPRASTSPNKKGPIIWYEKCLFKNLNTNFLQRSDTYNAMYAMNTNFIYDNPNLFYQKVHYLLRKLGLSISDTIYVVAQCTGDLSSIHCKTCLDVAVTELLNKIRGRIGGGAYYGNCYLIFELFSFILG